MHYIQLKKKCEEIIRKYICQEREKENLPPLTSEQLNLFIEYNKQTIQIAVYDLFKILEDSKYIINKNINIELPPKLNNEKWMMSYIKEYI